MPRRLRPPAPVPRGRRAIQPPPRIGRAATDVVARFSREFGGAGMGDLATRWAEIVGAKIARLCTPVRLTGRGANGVLHVAAKGPAALLVEAEAARILDCVNTYCGATVARRLSISRAPARARASEDAHAPAAGLAPTARLKLEAELASIDDPRLKAALLKLGRGAVGGESVARDETE